MTEKRFLTSLLTEGTFLLALGILMLILPKITDITFGFMICLAFISYGGYRIINSIMLRNFSRHYILTIISGTLLTVCGAMLYLAPLINIMWIISVAGMYFILESITTTATAVMTKNILWWWQGFIYLSILQLLIGICTIIILPSAALWFVGVAAGIDFMISGILMINIYLGTNYSRFN